MQVYYDQALDQWMSNNVGRFGVTQFDIAPIVAIAYYKAAFVDNAVNAFKSTGCWPVNRFIFTDANFVASDLLNKEKEKENNENQNNKNELQISEENISDLEESNETRKVSSSLLIPITEISSLPTSSTSIRKRRA